MLQLPVKIIQRLLNVNEYTAKNQFDRFLRQVPLNERNYFSVNNEVIYIIDDDLSIIDFVIDFINYYNDEKPVFYRSTFNKVKIKTSDFNLQSISTVVMKEIENLKKNKKNLLRGKMNNLSSLGIFIRHNIIECEKRKINFNEVVVNIDVSHADFTKSEGRKIIGQKIELSLKYNKGSKVLLKTNMLLSVILNEKDDVVSFEDIVVNY